MGGDGGGSGLFAVSGGCSDGCGGLLCSGGLGSVVDISSELIELCACVDAATSL